MARTERATIEEPTTGVATAGGIATVFGGSGFIGRYVVKRLAAAGYVVRVAVRDTESALFLKTAGAVGQIVPLYASLSEPGTIARAVARADLVVNLVGLLAEQRRGDFRRVHAEGAGHVARLAAEARVGRLVHLSAIGAAKNSPSVYGRTKAEGEAAVRAGFPGATVLRPSIVFGPEDHFFNRFAGMAKFLPIMPVIAGRTKLQPVYVGDVADAVMAALTRQGAEGWTFELGGPEVLSFRDILAYILREIRRPRWLVPVPGWLAHLQAAFAEHLPGTPFTRDQLRMLSRDNVVAPGAPGLDELDVTPTPIGLVVPSYLRRYRPGGGKAEPLALEPDARQKGPERN